MRYLLILTILYSCSERNTGELIDTRKLVINGEKFSQPVNALTKPDSSYRAVPGSCYYLSCDTCEYRLTSGTWRIVDNDSAIFSSIRLTPHSYVDVEGIRITTQTTIDELLKIYFFAYEFQELESKNRNMTAIVFGTADGCQLHFRFEDGKLTEIVYGVFSYL